MPIYKDNQRGTWYFDIRYRDNTGKVRSIKRRGFETEQKAKNAERKMIRELSIADLPKTSLTVKEIGLEMVESNRYDIKEQTYKSNLHKVNNFMPSNKISSINPRKALVWRNSIAEITTPIKIKKDGSTIGGKPYSTKYKNEIIALYKSIFKYALKMDYIQKDPTTEIKAFRKQYEDTIQYSVVSYEGFLTTWNKLPTKTMINIYFKMFVLLAFSTGARRAELKALTFNDYDGRGININKSITGKSSDRNKIEKTKTPASVRYVELDDFTIRELDEYITFVKSKYKTSSRDYLFGLDTPLANNTIQYSFKRMDLGCRFHDLRHSHATILIQNGVPINVVSKRLGHSTVEMTLKVYTHVFEESQNQAVNVMNKLSNK